MALTPPPTVATPSDSPTVFDAKMWAQLGWYSTNVTELSALQADVAAKQLQTSIDAAAASAASSAAVASAAAAAMVAAVWVSGATYAIGDVCWSPVTYFSYRRKSAGAGVIDPSLDAGKWVCLTWSPPALDPTAALAVINFLNA